MNGANKLEKRYYNPRKRYFRKRKYNITSYKKHKKCICWLCKEEGYYANECPKRKEKKQAKYYKIYEEILGNEEFEPIEDSEFNNSESLYELDSEVEEEESSLDAETIKEPMCMLRAYTQEEDISQEDIQEIEDDKIVSGNLVYQKLIFTIKLNYFVSLADENLDRCLNLYYQLHRLRMPRGRKVFSITTKIIYAFCTSHHKEIIKVRQNSNIEIKDKYSYIAKYIPPRQLVKTK
ncbi:hypothetical protein M9H77_22110 [Catharanthus roseus]|uniref:Uncharacterized protein n=1 Tax=Catharanthus roseus TaxID=4058 RepID=A0ACC0AP65_CATRO|nr:hypothetical protein M9H77_22110 [Catharanthus roseus]